MNHHTYFAAEAGSTPVECCIVGTGGFGRSFLAQSRRMQLLSTRIAVDISAEPAAGALKWVGIAADAIAVCAAAEAARQAWEAGRFIAAGELEIVLGLPCSVVIEATGHPEAGARHARLAVDAGKHVALVSKEVDSVVGPVLARRAAGRGRVVTPVDGDQPSLLIGLITWAEVLGLEIVAAGKSSEYDFIFDPRQGTLTSNGVTVPAPEFGQWLDLAGRSCAEVAAGRAAAASALPQRAVPDLCEMTVVANAVGYSPDRPELHAPIARIAEVADFLALREDGGLLARPASLDVFHCLRLPGEVSFAGGVFVVVRCTDADTWTMLKDKGHVVARNGRTAMLYLPRHLLGVEAATSILEAGLKGISSGAAAPRPTIDLVAHADADLPAGTVLTASGHHHSIANVSGRMVPAAALGPTAPVPFYLAANRRLTRTVRQGALITCADVALDEGPSELLALRREQDAVFLTAGSGGRRPAPV
jgi:predicted homoserine dehydrogenase-like protein